MSFVNVHLFTEGKVVGYGSVLTANVPNISILQQEVKKLFSQTLEGVEAPALDVYVGTHPPNTSEKNVDPLGPLVKLSDITSIDFALVYESVETRDRKRKRSEKSGTAPTNLVEDGHPSPRTVAPSTPNAHNTSVDSDKSTSQERLEKALNRLRTATFQVPSPPKAKLSTEILHRSRSKDDVQTYLLACFHQNQTVVSREGKFSLLGAAGVKGIGKTEVLAQICSGAWRPAELIDAKTIYVTYNGGGAAGDYCTAYNDIKDKLADSFGHLLLCTCGIPQNVAVDIPVKNAIEYTRSQMKCGDNESLIVCIDEIIEVSIVNRVSLGDSLANQLAEQLISSIMKVQDFFRGRLIFVFTAITKGMLLALQTATGRKVVPMCLEPLPPSVFLSEQVLGKALLSKCNEVPHIHQLVLSCCGHPRALFDGLPLVQTTLTSLGKNDNFVAVVLKARSSIIAECKFDELIDDSWLPAMLKRWFNLIPLSSADVEECALSGLLLRIATDSLRTEEFFLPLIMQHWAEANIHTTFGYHLSQCYAYDLVLAPGSEKNMEGVMYHYEAVLRKAMEGQSFSLQEFYQSDHIGTKFRTMDVVAPVKPSWKSLVVWIDDFCDIDAVLKLLNDGFIVVSQKWNEVGVEYLAPFRRVQDNSLIVATVQCKFVTDTAKWSEIKDKMLTATAELKKKGVAHFPVIYTTADQKNMNEDTFSDGIYFVETDIFQLTKKLGILRLHLEKLGGVLKGKIPFLGS